MLSVMTKEFVEQACQCFVTVRAGTLNYRHLCTAGEKLSVSRFFFFNNIDNNVNLLSLFHRHGVM